MSSEKQVIGFFKTAWGVGVTIIVFVGSIGTTTFFIQKNVDLQEINTNLESKINAQSQKIIDLQLSNIKMEGWKDGVNNTIQSIMQFPASSLNDKIKTLTDRMDGFHRGSADQPAPDTTMVLNRL